MSSAKTKRGKYSLDNAKDFGWSSVSGNIHPERAAHLENYLKGNKILDAGCGGGGYLEYLSNKGFVCAGVDANAVFVDFARKRYGNSNIFQADLTQLPFDDNSFDTTFSFDVLEHVDDDFKVMKELARVTRNRLLIAIPRQNSQRLASFGLAFGTYVDLTHLRYYSLESAESLFRSVPHSSLTMVDEIPIDIKNIAAGSLRIVFGGALGSWFLTKLFRLLLRRSVQIRECAGILGVIDLIK